jgi:hypothetical protein
MGFSAANWASAAALTPASGLDFKMIGFGVNAQ